MWFVLIGFDFCVSRSDLMICFGVVPWLDFTRCAFDAMKCDETSCDEMSGYEIRVHFRES